MNDGTRQTLLPAVPGSTYWCFTPDQAESFLADWAVDGSPSSDISKDARTLVRAFLYDAGLLRCGMRKETKREHNPVLESHGE